MAYAILSAMMANLVFFRLTRRFVQFAGAIVRCAAFLLRQAPQAYDATCGGAESPGAIGGE